ncbi:MAG: flagellar protein FlgN [Lachnospiraceae bacterium]|nr:flagellar protein FlgN [Lachnospiraceae bacterium]
MASLMEELIDVLGEEQQQYDALLQVSMNKTGAIISNDLNKLQEISAKEQDILDVLVNVDKKRETCMQNIASVMNKKPGHMTVSRIVELMEGQPEYQKPLAKLHNTLKQTIEQLKQISLHNQDLLQDAVEMTEFDINLLQSLDQAPETANYGKGDYSGETLGVSTSRFDTKQ